MRVPDEILKCVAFVGFAHQEGQVVSLEQRATAFFASVPSLTDPDRRYLYLVTAKHVADRLHNKLIGVRLNKHSGGDGVAVGENLQWITHPTDPLVDVAVLPFGPPSDIFDYKHVPSSMFATDAEIGKYKVGAGDEVFITGLFHKLRTNRVLPIVRTGNIAMMPDTKVPTTFGEVDAYLVEARSIGGISGSPVFVPCVNLMQLDEPWFLLGLMHGHWDIPPEAKNDEVKMDSLSGQVNMGIAIVVPAKHILETLNHPQLMAIRQASDETKRDKHLPTPDVVEEKQKTHQGKDIPIPKRSDVMRDLEKATRRKKAPR